MASDSKPVAVRFDCDEVVLRGEQWHAGDGAQQVLFLHEGGQTRHSWDRCAREVAARGRTATTIDLRGHGDSDWSRSGRYTLQANRDDLHRVVRELGARPVVVGASLGGLTALAAQGVDDEMAAGLVLVDIVPRPSPEGVQRIRDFMTRHLGGFDSLDLVADAVAVYTGRERGRDIDGLKRNVRQRDDGRWYWHWDPQLMSSQGDLDTPPIPVDDLLAAAGNISVPVLTVRGGRSDVVTDKGIAELARAVKDARVAEVPGAGHMVAGDANEAFTYVVLDFLESGVPPSPRPWLIR